MPPCNKSAVMKLVVLFIVTLTVTSALKNVRINLTSINMLITVEVAFNVFSLLACDSSDEDGF